jgi:hypothetical protein
LLALPFQDVAVHSFGFGWALQGVNCLGLIHGIIKVSSTNLNVQILGFIVFSFFRRFLFSVTFSCLACFTSPNVTGRAVGMMYIVSGVASFINIGLANLAVEKLDDDFFIPNLIFVVFTVPMIYITYILGKSLNIDQDALRILRKHVEDVVNTDKTAAVGSVISNDVEEETVPECNNSTLLNLEIE